MLKNLIYEKRSRGLLIQAVFLAGLIWMFSFLIGNAADNLKAQGVATGFSFLSETAGFSIIQSLIPYSESSSYLSVFWVGLLNTLLVSVVGIVLATILGVLLGISRLSSNYLVSKISEAYIEIIRNIPLLLQIFFWYFVVLRSLPHPRKSFDLFDSIFINNRGVYIPSPIFSDAGSWFLGALVLFTGFCIFYLKKSNKVQINTGRELPVFKVLGTVFVASFVVLYFIFGAPFTLDYPVLKGFNFRGGVTLIPEFIALLFSLVIYTAAFIGEIVRAGILAVPKGQVEAADALGLKKSVVLRKVVLPQALRVIIPPLTSQFLNLTKNSSLAAAIGYPELVSVFAGTVLNQTGQAVEVILITMSVYMTISLIISFAMNVYNKKKALVER
jgi:general L-amino acid transport system permease protein